MAHAATTGIEQGNWNRARFFREIDGLTFGPGAKEGAIDGQSYVNTVDRIGWTAPDGFSIRRDGSRVLTREPNGGQVVFSRVETERHRDPLAYLTDQWAKSTALRDVERLDINGMTAATGSIRTDTRQGPVDVRLVVIAVQPGVMHRFFIATPVDRMAALDVALRRMVYGVRRLTDREIEQSAIRSIRIITAGARDSVRTLSARMAYDTHREARFRALNGLGPQDAVNTGEAYKIVAR